MVYRYGALEISGTGRAMEQGAIGDIISVMNLDSRKQVNGVVVDSNTVEMQP
jgi:flagella basal body P-ring formation protein FlgA